MSIKNKQRGPQPVKKNSQDYQAGYDAAKAGLWFTANPHKAPSTEYNEWRKGWHVGRGLVDD